LITRYLKNPVGIPEGFNVGRKNNVNQPKAKG
jgi:hypothetical protein